MPDQIRNIALQWAKAMESRIPQNVLDLYHPDGVLWGTLSPVIRHGHEEILDYFVKFLQWENLKCEFKEGVIRIHGNYAFYSGAYVFTWKVSNKTATVPARFSFVYTNTEGQWLILEHHSSLYPDLPFKIRKYLTV